MNAILELRGRKYSQTGWHGSKINQPINHPDGIIIISIIIIIIIIIIGVASNKIVAV